MFPIIGIGASAGGLEALETFFGDVPAPCGSAFVVVQHLDPSHKGLLVELLQRKTQLKVLEATDGTRVEREHVYVIPPGKDMSLVHRTLHILPQPTSRGRVMPIDFFFRSLAQDQCERSIGVILSGIGTDGTLGLRAIKETAGAAFVQSPETATFDSMPRNAIDAGLADVVAPIGELPRRILSYRDHATFITSEIETRLSDPQGSVDKICALLNEYSGNDFSLYKRSTIFRRIERRMGLLQISGFPEYHHYLKEHSRERELLFEELLIGVTSFFRDPAEWERLCHEVLPALVSSRAASGVIRAWVVGCSTGEEAYSLAMVLREAVERVNTVRNIAVQIFATDLDRNAIEKARLGLYPENIAADVSPERLRRFFVREERGYRVTKDIRETVVFAPQSVISDPPFTKVDVVACRNLLIYLSSEVQKKLIPLFHRCLHDGGSLFLGTAETVGPFTTLFVPLDGHSRIYRRLDQPAVAVHEDAAVGKATGPNLQMLVDRLLVLRFSPLGILCNTKGDILYVSGRAGKFLEPAVGEPSVNVLAMAREGLRCELSSAFTKVLRMERPVTVRDIKVGTNGGVQNVHLTVQKLTEPKELRGTVLVVIAEAPAKIEIVKGTRPGLPRLAEIEDELQRARDEAQMVREELQTSQQELESTNEELQSTNEELQSTYEELSTSKEEMQSLYEELQTVNHELQSKVDELSRSDNDMKNLLKSTDLAFLFLDADLRVRRFTTPTAKIIKLIPADIGRPITDLASDLDYPELADDAREVLRTLILKEKQATTRDGRAYSVRVMPYRTLENVIDGVVITFADASAVRALETAAREQASQLRQLTESLPNLVWGARADGAFDYIGRQWVEYTGVPEAEQLHWGWIDQLHPDDRGRVRDHWRRAVREGVLFDTELRIHGRSGSYAWFNARAVPIRDSAGTILKWYGTGTDVDRLKRTETRLARILGAVSDAFVALDRERRVVAANAAAERALGRDAGELAGKPFQEIVPEARALPVGDGRLPSTLDFALDGRRYAAHVHADEEGGAWLFLEPIRSAA
jgi:two-component system CheB/CheR fusion protein